MQISPYDPYDEVHAWGTRRPRWSPSRTRFLRLVVVAGGALAITLVTILIVAGFQMLQSENAKLLTQAAKDKARAVALNAAKSAECDRLVSEAQAAAQPLPPCAAGSKDDQHASKASNTDVVVAAGVEVAKSALLAAAAD